MAVIANAYDELVIYLAERASPAEVLEFTVSEAAQYRATELLERNQTGELAPDEHLELQQMLHFDRLVSVLKARAIEKLQQT